MPTTNQIAQTDKLSQFDVFTVNLLGLTGQTNISIRAKTIKY